MDLEDFYFEIMH
jgi:hypothetical protein